MKTNLLLATALMSAAFAGPALAQTATASATLTDLSGNALGTLTLTEESGGVRITGELTSVPNGEHGFHIHETGACDAETKFESAGGHFNPDGKEHGLENPNGPHAGDMSSVIADNDGNVAVDVTNPGVTLAADAPNSIADADGSALMLHTEADDHMTDPGGNAGDRFACGVIEVAE